MIHYVYQTTNLVNGKIYVGLHKKSNRKVDHYLGSGRLLKSAILKYGRENFDFKILHVCNNREEAELKEAEIVNEEFVLREDTYNLVIGGIGGKGKSISEEHRNAIRNSKLGIPRSKEVREKVSKTRKLLKIPSPNKGKDFTDAHRRAISAKKVKAITIDGKYFSCYADAAKEYNLSATSVGVRVRSDKWPLWRFCDKIKNAS